ncbi:unnamed protein product [Linum trigynum]|uniref:Uncharacterized protein n=1 Tax=Linum trigynum TaxID=586398 RepID=A0AAV2F826_9ROSI
MKKGDNKLVPYLKELKEKLKLRWRGINIEVLIRFKIKKRKREPRTMGYYMAPLTADIQSPILLPPAVANNFEIKRALVTMIQNNALFHVLASASPREHVQRFLELAGSLKVLVNTDHSAICFLTNKADAKPPPPPPNMMDPTSPRV